MTSTLTAAELPQHERGAAYVPSRERIVARLAAYENIVRTLAARLPHDLDDAALIGVARGLDAVADALSQTSAAGLGRALAKKGG